MSRRRVLLQRALIAALLIGALFLLTSCGFSLSSAQNTLAPEGSVAERQRHVLLVYLWPAVAVFILVEGLILYMVFRYRQRKGDDTIPKQVHGNPAIEIMWSVAPAILLAIVSVPALTGVIDLSRDPKEGAVDVQVTAAQWIWQFSYPDFRDANGQPITSTNDLHIPAGREVGILLHSSDVIHSFWVPKLAGKTDVIPGRENHMWVKADHPGEYSGQCAEFCGFGHAGMRLKVIVQSEQDFDAWAKQQQSQSASSGTSSQWEELASRE